MAAAAAEPEHRNERQKKKEASPWIYDLDLISGLGFFNSLSLSLRQSFFEMLCRVSFLLYKTFPVHPSASSLSSIISFRFCGSELLLLVLLLLLSFSYHLYLYKDICSSSYLYYFPDFCFNISGNKYNPEGILYIIVRLYFKRTNEENNKETTRNTKIKTKKWKTKLNRIEFKGHVINALFITFVISF